MAVWNADKIFQDGCRTQQEQGLELLEDCRRALATPLPAPPGSSFNLRKRAGDNIREIASELQLLVADKGSGDFVLEVFLIMGLGFVILCISLTLRRELVLPTSFGVLKTWLMLVGTVVGLVPRRMLIYPANPLTATIWWEVLFIGALVILKVIISAKPPD